MYNVFCIAHDGSHFGGHYYPSESEALEALTSLCDEGYTVAMSWDASAKQK